MEIQKREEWTLGSKDARHALAFLSVRSREPGQNLSGQALRLI